MARVLLADSQPLLNEALAALLSRDGRHQVVAQATSAAEVTRAAASHRPDLALLDAAMALGEKPPLLAGLCQAHPELKPLVLADQVSLELTLASVRAGAVGVLPKTATAATILRSLQAAADGEGVVPRALLPQLLGRLATGPDPADTPAARLSGREREVLALLGRGWDNHRIGQALFISPNTVRTHVQNILDKLGMHSKLEAATFAMRHGLQLTTTL
jgi:DNA-binding NarL/FixJ family response regulator